MFPTSTQRKHWMFSGEDDLKKLREKANKKYVEGFGEHLNEEERSEKFLSPTEEYVLLRFYINALREFCVQFQPPMPKYVIGTSMMYFRRFYLNNSIMDYHPKDIMLTCVYLGCKVEEFNVSIMQFVKNLKSNREKMTDMILSYELLLMHELTYHLTVHNPYRPLEGLVIDIKTRCKSLKPEEVDRSRQGADEFLDRVLQTDAALLYAPSQIALSALLSSASKLGINLDSYATEFILGSGTKEQAAKTTENIKSIRYMVKHIPPLDKKEGKKIGQKLEKCRNQENNPDSEVFKRKQQEMLDDEDEVYSRKKQKISQEEKDAEKELLGL